MPVSLYMDHHVPKAITTGLRLRGVDVLTSYEDGTDQLSDDKLLQRAHELKRALFTQDDDLLEEAAKCHREGKPFFALTTANIPPRWSYTRFTACFPIKKRKPTVICESLTRAEKTIFSQQITLFSSNCRKP